MNNILKKPVRILLILAITFQSTACMTTKTSVGVYREIPGDTYTYAKGKQMWVFWGLIPLGRTSVNTPSDGNCEVITRYNFGDLLISGLTGGLFMSYTIKVVAKRQYQGDLPSTNKLHHVWDEAHLAE